MLRTDRDIILCILWATTYTLVLIGTKRYKYPLISPITQILIASLEWSVLYQLILTNKVGWNHIWISYLYWALIEIAIIVQQIKCGYINKGFVGYYMVAFVVATIVMCYLVAYKGLGFFLNYFNTFLGELIWLYHIQKPDYPTKPIVLILFITKFVADVIAISVYWGRGSHATNLICILLPILDFMFIHVYFQRKIKNESNQ